TGPAFEGAQISCGQRAAPGAIERVRIDAATLEPRVKVIGCDLWSDEPGFAAATAATGVTGICGSGIIEVIAELYLAGVIRHDGAFGSHIDVKYAMVLGMIPDCALDKVSSAGNAAGTGARIALLDQRTRTIVEGLVRRIEKIETAVAPRFQEFFVEAMAIPHLSAPYPELRKVVTLPEVRAGKGDLARRSRRAERRTA